MNSVWHGGERFLEDRFKIPEVEGSEDAPGVEESLESVVEGALKRTTAW